jgi:hypothetical protein
MTETTEAITQTTILEARRAEVAGYEANIVLYKTILNTLPTVWPTHLEKYRGATNQHEASVDVDLADIELLSKLWYADECNKAIRSETVEMTKSKSILAVLEAQAQTL